MMKAYDGTHRIWIKTIALVVLCLFIVNDIALAGSSPLNPSRNSLAAELRLKPFVDKHEVDFKNTAAMIYAAQELKKLALDGHLSPSEIEREINHLNRLELFKSINLLIENKIFDGEVRLEGGTAKQYKYAVIHSRNIRDEEVTFQIKFLGDRTRFTDAELVHLGIRTDKDKEYLDFSGLEDVWFVNPDAVEKKDSLEKPLGSLSIDPALKEYLQKNTNWLSPGKAITTDDFRALHKWCSRSEYHDGVHRKEIDERYPPTPTPPGYFRKKDFTDKNMGTFCENIGTEMDRLTAWLNETTLNNVTQTDTLEKISAEAYLRFIDIHPFGDRNGRVGRLLINVLLARFHRPQIEISLLPWNDPPAIGFSDILPDDADHLAELIRRAQKGLSSVGMPRHGPFVARKKPTMADLEERAQSVASADVLNLYRQYIYYAPPGIFATKKILSKCNLSPQDKLMLLRIIRTTLFKTGHPGAIRESLELLHYCVKEFTKDIPKNEMQAFLSQMDRSQNGNRFQFPESYGGTMGRWKYTHTTLAEDGTLTLHDATRIPRKDGVVEEEFLIEGANNPRDIVLKTRILTSAERRKISPIMEKMGAVIEPRVIIREESAIHNRIYGIATKGIPFIRQDIIKKGNPNQIREALDHENRELTAASHDDIRNEQHQGGLRPLITNLSDRDKFEKEAEKIHAENVKPEYAPAIPGEELLVHVIADSILPDSQVKDGILNRLQAKMRNQKYSEKVVSLPVNVSDSDEEFMEKLRALKSQLEGTYPGYTVQFDVACPRESLVEKVQKQGMQALAFSREGDGYVVQVEGIILALRALRTKSIANLLNVFKLITGKEYATNETDINALARLMLFILPVRRVDVNKIGAINRLMEENIKAAA